MTVNKRINSLYASFIWKSKAHKMNQDDVYKTKNEGGFGIRRIDDIIKAMAVKLVWKFIQNKTVWAKWMRKKYCNDKKNWSATMNNNTSYTWKLLLKGRQWCKGVIDRKIVNGENSEVWLDPWINGHSLVDKFNWNA